MATNTRQATIDRYGVLDYERGDLLERDYCDGRGAKVRLTECPFCRMDPTRPRYRFGDGESRPRHFETVHDATAISARR